MKKTAVILLLAFVVLSAFAEEKNRYADSLLHIIKTKRLTDLERAKLYADITEWYCAHDMPNTFKYGTMGLEAALRCDDKALIFRFYNYIGSTYTYRCSYDTAKVYLDLQIAAAEASGNKKLVQKAWQAAGNFYARQGQFILAVESYINILKYFDGDESSRDYIIAHGNIGECYRRMGNPKRALHYLERERVLAEQYGEPTGIGQSYRELGYVYLALGDADKALECMLKVKPKERSAPVNYADLCEALVKAYLMKGKYQEALACAAECKYAAQWLGDPYIHTLTWNIYADIYRAQGRYDECRTAALKAWSIDSVSINTAPVSAFNIAFASAMLGRRDEAARFFGLYDRMMNERTDRNYHEALSQMEVVYETEKKQQQIASLEKERGFYIVMGVSGALIFLLVFGLLFYRHRLNRGKRELAERKVKQLEQEKQLVATLALLDGETAERTRLARDLHDGLGSMLSVIKLHLHGIRNFSTLTEADTERLAKARVMLDELAVELRRVAHNLMPESLSHCGLKAALEDFCRSIPIADFRFFGEDTHLDNRLEVLIYRCAYELVNNAMKHAEASRINVQLTVDARLVSLSVQDDGRGFDPDTVTYGAGFTNIRNRISAYNGKISVYSSPGAGTEVTIEIELAS
ncbi:tetratricopeptide repeat-containing sensor histidine kinase [Tannerella forsythia]